MERMRGLIGAICRVVLVVGVVGVATPLTAQIRLVPQAKRDSVANPPVVDHAPMRFDEQELNFGTIDVQGGPWQGEFRWHNAADHPLVITRVVTSCGCLQATYDPAPVVAGGEATVRVQYNPKGHPGAVYQRLFLYTNLAKERPTAILSLKGAVRRSERLEEYPHRRGSLLIEQPVVTFAAPHVAARCELLCLNDGSQVVEPRLDTLLTPSGVTLRCIPKQLQPQERGRLIVEYDPAEVQRAARTSEASPMQRLQGAQPIQALYLRGEEPPRMRRMGIVWQQPATMQK